MPSVKVAVKPQAARNSTFGFGAGPRMRRKMIAPKGGPSDQELIDAFLARNVVTKCVSRTLYAEGAIEESGFYKF